VPAPAGAYLLLMPLGINILSQRFGLTMGTELLTLSVLAWTLLISVLMISTIPTPSLKSIKFNLSKTRRVIILISVCISVSVLLRETCIFLLTLGGLYVVSLPLFSSRIRRSQSS
jgi:phosphatidylserine synthase